MPEALSSDLTSRSLEAFSARAWSDTCRRVPFLRGLTMSQNDIIRRASTGLTPSTSARNRGWKVIPR